MRTFLQRFGSMVKGVLSGFDRLRFRGTRRLLANLGGMKHFLWHSRVPLHGIRQLRPRQDRHHVQGHRTGKRQATRDAHWCTYPIPARTRAS